MNDKRFTIALLGIDGSGKSTIGKMLQKWLIENGYNTKIVPFHKWIFADKLKKKTWKYIDKDRPSIERPYEPKKRSIAAIIKPFIALLDNILFYIRTLPDGKKYQVTIYDRFVCATQIKFNALNYRSDWLRPIWWNFKPDFAIIFDVPEDISIKRQTERGDPYLYTKEQLSKERALYKQFSKDHNYLLIQNINSKEVAIESIKNELKKRELL